MKIERLYTKEDINPFDMTEYEVRKSVIRESGGKIRNEIVVEVPIFWSQTATDVLAQKYLRKAGIPLPNNKLGGETSVKQVVHRLVECWKQWGIKYNYFSSEQDAKAYYDEMVYMLLFQICSPNSPQWFNTGLNTVYGLTGSAQGHWYIDPVTEQPVASQDAYSRPAPHACFIQSISDHLIQEGGIFDLVMREARVFKFGGGSGSNFSNLRARGEPIQGGGVSSGVMSFLKVNDRAAGAIKSGGTTRRAAKMVCLDLNHPEILEFIEWKSNEEDKVAYLYAGKEAAKSCAQEIWKSSNTKDKEALQKAFSRARKLKMPKPWIQRIADLGRQNIEYGIIDFSLDFEDEAYETVSGQNSNNSIRVPNKFFELLERDEEWELVARTTKKVVEKIKAKEIWDRIAKAAWISADPGLQFDDTINEWNTCAKSGKIEASNPCAEYMFLSDTACNLASLNLVKFLKEDGTLDHRAYEHACRLWTITLEISVTMAQFPSKEIAIGSYLYRTLGLGYANLGSFLMRIAIPYASNEACAWTSLLSAIMHGVAYRTSAEMAKELGPFKKYEENKACMLKVVQNHREALLQRSRFSELTIRPIRFAESLLPKESVAFVRKIWDDVLILGEQYGFRNAQVTVLAPTGTIALQMDCDTTGIEPDFALVKYKKLAGGGYLKLVNSAVEPALKRLNYSDDQIREILQYANGISSIYTNLAPINAETLKGKGFSAIDLENIERTVPLVFSLYQALSPTTISRKTLEQLGFTKEELEKTDDLDILSRLGFSIEEINISNEIICGRMTIEGAPHLEEKHYSIFDCASKCGERGVRYIQPEAHLNVMAAAQPFISGAISKTINLPPSATVEDIKKYYRAAHGLMLKAVALYRDGCKLSQPLNSTIAGFLDNDDEIEVEEISRVNIRKKLPSKRHGTTVEATIGGQKVFLRTGEYADGSLGEVFFDVYKVGASFQGIFACFSILLSKSLQYGVPLEDLVDTFTFTRFEPSGIVSGDDNIRNATSLVDYLFRFLAVNYLGRQDLAHVLDDKSFVKDEMSLNKKTSHEMSKSSRAKQQGYTGDSCKACGSMRVRRTGTCSTCEQCGSTSGCS